MSEEDQKILSVSDYLSLVNDVMQESIASQDLAVEGEVSDFRIAQQKWISFDLKDEKEQAVLKCFMTVWQLKIPLEDGMRVVVKGAPKIYERFGTFKMNVQSVELVGEGALRRAYELLKKKLTTEGLFDPSHKRPLPRFPERIGLVTSRDAAAFGDFVRILNNRWGGIAVDHYHVHVQGRLAVSEILRAFTYFNGLAEDQRPDVLVITRGGGGLEDLHAFNDEQVARAVFQSVIPVVCAVGHERDESLSDFVADVRSSTPSNAAERLVPNRSEFSRELDFVTQRLQERYKDGMREYALLVERSVNLMGVFLDREVQRIDLLKERLTDRAQQWLPAIHDRLESLARFLSQLDPKRVLARGYSIVTQKGKVLKDAKQLVRGEEVRVQLSQGVFDAEVLRVNGKGKQPLL